MSQRLLVSDLQNSRVPVSLNVCPTDERFYQWLGEAEQRMLNQGRWVGSVREIQMCKDPCDGCITWPRQVDAVEQVAVNGQPIASFNGWYSYTRLLTNLKQCRGCGCSSSAGNTRTDGTFGAGGGCGCQYVENRMKEGDVASFATTRGENKVIRTYPTDTNDVGKKIIYQGNDSNGIWVRTEIDGVMSDGEQVTLALPQRFWNRVEKSEDPTKCWVWKGWVKPVRPPWYPYLSFRAIKDTPMPAHRVAFFLANGYLPEKGKQVLHSCGVHGCCNPSHLYEGTPRLNYEDAVRHGTFKPIKPKHGEDVHNAKLTVELVMLIRHVYPLLPTLLKAPFSKLCGVTMFHMRRIAKGECWEQVESYSVKDS